ncbi:MAG: glycosyltransferase family 1 protein [Actinomycetota bacterium]|nr:glycosyltransferase family 1 protein [Actinomycetota bacterium]
MTRVLLDCRMAEWTGVGRYTKGLVRALARTSGIEVVQAVDTGPAPEPDAETVHAGGIPLAPRGWWSLGSAARHVRPDVVHSPHFPVPMPAPHPLVATLHDLTPLRVPGVMPSAVQRAIFARMVGRAARVSDALITGSHHAADDIARSFPAARGKLRVIAHGVDDFASGAVGTLPAELAGAGPYILGFANTRPHKGLDVLLRAFAELVADDPAPVLALVGPPAPDAIARAIADPGVRERVRVLGRADDDTLRALYKGALVFAFPSLYEGFGLPPLEAMSFGTPAVCSDATAIPEVVGDTALLFAAGDAHALAARLREIIHNEPLRERLRQAGTARVSAFTWDAAAAATVRVYEEVVSAR